MPTRSAAAVWEGDLRNGKGSISLDSGAFAGSYTFASRFEQGPGTNPEELIAAAHAGCFSMALSGLLKKEGYTAERIHTVARVRIDRVGQEDKITGISLDTEGKVPGIQDAFFMQLAEEAKKNCPVSRALGSVPVTLNAKLVHPMAA